MALQKIKRQIVYMVEQCFAIQNTYGKSAKQLEILMQAMIEDLQRYPLGNIEIAFKEWRRKAKLIPTPADIIEIIEDDLRHERRMAELSAPPERPQPEIVWASIDGSVRAAFDLMMAKVKRNLAA